MASRTCVSASSRAAVLCHPNQCHHLDMSIWLCFSIWLYFVLPFTCSPTDQCLCFIAFTCPSCLASACHCLSCTVYCVELAPWLLGRAGPDRVRGNVTTPDAVRTCAYVQGANRWSWRGQRSRRILHTGRLVLSHRLLRQPWRSCERLWERPHRHGRRRIS